MSIIDLFSKFRLSKIKITTPFMEAEWEINRNEKEAAWYLYIELLTRVATQPLQEEEGCERSALDSIYSLFPVTRNILKEKGRECIKFSCVAILFLNQVARPFTSKWHRLSNEEDCFKDRERCKEFRKELIILQTDLKNYTALLANIAGVEDLTESSKTDV